MVLPLLLKPFLGIGGGGAGTAKDLVRITIRWIS